jgi:SAM-dependent methyltransferase
VVPLNASHDHDPVGYDRLRGGWLNRRRIQYFQDCVTASSPSVVVEMGSGTGRMLVELATEHPHTQFIGVEPLSDYVEFGRRLIAERGLDNVQLQVATAEGMGTLVPRCTTDLVISSDILHHVTSVPVVVRNVRATLRAAGRWCLVEPNPGNPYVGLFQALTRGERNFWPRSFVRLASAEGLVVTRRDRMFLIPARIAKPPGWLVEMEARLERAPILGGAVTMELTAV